MRSKKARVCGECGETYKFSIAEAHHYVESGLANVYLKSVETMTCRCGTAIVLAAVPTLLRVIAFCFAFKPARLKGNELRFIRNVLRRSAKDFANVLSVSPEHLSRVENEAEGVSPVIDKLVRSRIVIDLMDFDGFAALFDLKEFRTLVDGRLPESDNGFELHLEYEGPYLGARKRERLEFEFRAAA
jgi:transcriptional regulator with XRE-family HTH domain